MEPHNQKQIITRLSQANDTTHTINRDSKPFSYWLTKNKYYHERVISFYKTHIPVGSTILHVNCTNGYLLHALEASFALGVDADPMFINEAKNLYPHYQFFAGDLDDIYDHYQVDYIILSCATMRTDDVQHMLQSLHRFCHARTRIIIETYSHLWEPILWLTQKLGLKRATEFKHWISRENMNNFLYIAGFTSITSGTYMLMPMNIPGISWLFNKIFAHLPLVSRLCLHEWIVVRPQSVSKKRSELSVSVIIPCRNEEGNLQAAVDRLPDMGGHTQIIFVEGNSKDDTYAQALRMRSEHLEKDILVMQQEGIGKGDAVRKGFAHATGDILMILDADLTVPPEDLPKFFDLLASGRAEFVNGSRLVYGMESEAMRFLNLLANFFFGHLFSWLLGQRVKDTLCGTKVLWKSDYELIAKHRAFFGLIDPFGDFDLLFGAAKLNLKIIDMPVHYKRRTYGETNIRRFYHGWILLYMSLRALIVFKLR
jgi:hypothetical protein